MKTLLSQYIVIFCCLFFLTHQEISAQTGNSANTPSKFGPVQLTNSKLILTANAGVNFFGHYHFREQEYTWNTFPNSGSEIGLEALIIHKKGFALKGTFFNGIKHGGEENSWDMFTVQKFRGYSIGIGMVGDVSTVIKKGVPFTFIGILSASIGSSHAALWLDGHEDTFGDLEINGNEEKFYIDNYFIDLNMNGLLMNLNKANSSREKRVFFLTGLQLGALFGLHKSNWVRDSTQEYAAGVSRTLPYNFYIKFQLGIGANLNRW